MYHIFHKSLLLQAGNAALYCAAAILLACGAAGADPNGNAFQPDGQTLPNATTVASVYENSGAQGRGAKTSFPYTTAAGDEDISGVYAYPVPFKPNSGDSTRYGTWSRLIWFTYMPTVGTIRIYTLSGALVRSIDIASTPKVNNEIQWDVRNTEGAIVASGIYIWEVTSGPNRKTGKLAVIK